MMSKTERHLRMFVKDGFRFIFFFVSTNTQRMFPGGFCGQVWTGLVHRTLYICIYAYKGLGFGPTKRICTEWVTGAGDHPEFDWTRGAGTSSNYWICTE